MNTAVYQEIIKDYGFAAIEDLTEVVRNSPFHGDSGSAHRAYRKKTSQRMWENEI